MSDYHYGVSDELYFIKHLGTHAGGSRSPESVRRRRKALLERYPACAKLRQDQPFQATCLTAVRKQLEEIEAWEPVLHPPAVRAR